MAITAFISSNLEFKGVEARTSTNGTLDVIPRSRSRWRHLRPSNYQRNVCHSVVALLEREKNTRRVVVYSEIKKRWGLDVEIKRHYKGGGVGTWSWLPRCGCIRLQVGASRIDCKKHCYRYAPVVEIYDIYKAIKI